MKNENVNFYSYSAAENEEVKKIREKYVFSDKKNSKIEQLRKLDKSVHDVATAASIAVGIIGALIFGFGMSCVLVWAESLFVLGLICGVAGILLIAFAYPIYNAVSEKRKKKIAPRIISLADELMKP